MVLMDGFISRLEMAKGYDPYNNNAGDRCEKSINIVVEN